MKPEELLTHLKDIQPPPQPPWWLISSAQLLALVVVMAALVCAAWLRQVTLLAYPESQARSLCGERWLAFLDGAIGDNRFSQGCGRVFGTAIYRAQFAVDADALLQLCDHWLQAMTPRLVRRSRAP